MAVQVRRAWNTEWAFIFEFASALRDGM